MLNGVVYIVENELYVSFFKKNKPHYGIYFKKKCYLCTLNFKIK